MGGDLETESNKVTLYSFEVVFLHFHQFVFIF
jgi:hypothetical protein